MTNPCERCNCATSNPKNEFAEFICDDCEQNAAEAAWERFCGDFYGGADPLTVREKHVRAWEIKNGHR